MACDIAALEEEVRGSPRHAGARVRLGQALVEAGRVDEGAGHLRLAAGLEPRNPHLALIAAGALARCGRERDAALLLSTRIAPTRACTVVAPSELELVEALLAHPTALVRCHVARAAGRLRIAQLEPALGRACTDPNGAVRLAASASLRVLKAH